MHLSSILKTVRQFLMSSIFFNETMTFFRKYQKLYSKSFAEVQGKITQISVSLGILSQMIKKTNNAENSC